MDNVKVQTMFARRSVLSALRSPTPETRELIRRRAVLAFALLVAAAALATGIQALLVPAGGEGGLATSGSSHTLLKHLDERLVKAPWVAFTEAETYTSFTKSVRSADEGTPAAAAVVRVEVVAEAPPRFVYDSFTSPELTKKWNNFVGEVTHLPGGTQLQAYKFPWPFATREYLVQCADRPLRGSGFSSHCASTDAVHPKAPRRDDRVRGMSETLWQFTPVDGDAQRTTIVFEGIVDPRGNIPKRVINEIGKRTCVSTALALASVAVEAYERSRPGPQRVAAATAAETAALPSVPDQPEVWRGFSLLESVLRPMCVLC